MIVKDVLKQGYPFVEAIASALPVCDEFLISDGYSTDGTFEIVQRISESNKKVKVFKHKWPPVKNVAVLAEVTNSIREKCRFDYILSVQANEIIHEESWEYLKALPKMRPEVYTFSLPYLQLLATHKWTEEYRLRFAKNLPGIIAIEDAWTLGASTSFIRQEEFRNLTNPRKLLRYIGTGIEFTFANAGKTAFSKPVYLPKPIFRYWALFPSSFLEKCLKHAEMFNLPEFYKIVDNLKSHVNDPTSFWKLASELFRASQIGIQYSETLGVVEKKDHPALIRDFISDSTVATYKIRDEVLNMIKEL